jgi:hypothetical protein
MRCDYRRDTNQRHIFFHFPSVILTALLYCCHAAIGPPLYLTTCLHLGTKILKLKRLLAHRRAEEKDGSLYISESGESRPIGNPTFKLERPAKAQPSPFALCGSL